MPGAVYRSIHDLAADQHGYFTTAEARQWGVSPMALVMMANRNTVERLSHGVYRLAQFPASPLGHYMEATLWPGPANGVISHQSALALYEVSDVSPARIHVTVPRKFRTHREVPRRLALHRADLQAHEVQAVEGIAVTTLERAIADCAGAHLGRELISQAIVEGFRAGRLTRSAAARLRARHIPRT